MELLHVLFLMRDSFFTKYIPGNNDLLAVTISRMIITKIMVFSKKKKKKARIEGTSLKHWNT